jgi:predicted nucleotide-binding protein
MKPWLVSFHPDFRDLHLLSTQQRVHNPIPELLASLEFQSTTRHTPIKRQIFVIWGVGNIAVLINSEQLLRKHRVEKNEWHTAAQKTATRERERDFHTSFFSGSVAV